VSVELVKARIEAEAARRRLTATIGELQQRLKPATLATNAWEGMKDKSGELAEDAVQAVKSRPVAVSAVLAAVTLFLARAPIKSAVAGLFSDDAEEPEAAPPVQDSTNKPRGRRRRADA